MRTETIQKLCCPFDRSDLELTTITTNVDGNVIEGYLSCERCKRMYPIVKGVPIMSPDEYREYALEQPLLDRWSKHIEGKTFSNFRLKSSHQ